MNSKFGVQTEKKLTISPKDICITVPVSTDPLSSFGQAALKWFEFGFKVIPIGTGTKTTAVKWDGWLDGLSVAKITAYWSKHPDHEVGFIVSNDYLVLDADSSQSKGVLAELEKAFDITPNLIVSTQKGLHHYFRLAKDAYARSDSHSTEQFPDRLDVKTGRAMVVLPPSTGKSVEINEADRASDLVEIGQDFIDAVFRHNGRPAPRPLALVAPTQNDAQSPASSLKVAQLKALLKHISPDMGYENWLHCGMAIFHETDGSEEGEILFHTWSSNGKTYGGRKDIETKWKSFKAGTANPITIATLKKMVTENGGDWLAILAADEPQFKKCAFTVVRPDELAPEAPIAPVTASGPYVTNTAGTNPLDRFSLLGCSEEIERLAVEQVPFLGQVALKGQMTAFYAGPNTGKTLLTVHLLINAIRTGLVKPSDVYYFNNDDSSQGLAEKSRIADEYGFNMLAEGHRGFSAKMFPSLVTELVESDQARNKILILDTLKKFVNLMDKCNASGFSKILRPFSLKGGTVIALAHTNKNLAMDGSPIYGGTSDIVDDFDCAYTLAPIKPQVDPRQKVVSFDRIKNRGNVVQRATYGYSTEKGISYNEVLLSVQELDEEQLDCLQKIEATKLDSEVITAVKACINRGINTKMKLAIEVAGEAGISKRAAIHIIDKYTGENSTEHQWKYSVGARGAKNFIVLDTVPATTVTENASS